MWMGGKKHKCQCAVFVEKDGEFYVDFCGETGIITPAFERTPDFENRFEKDQKNLKIVLDRLKTM